MKSIAVTFHLKFDDQERAWLGSRIEYYFTNCVNGEKHLFGDIRNTQLILDVLHKIKTNKLCVEITWFQAKLLVDVIEDRERRMHVKTGEIYIPKDFDHRDMYDELLKLSRREI